MKTLGAGLFLSALLVCLGTAGSADPKPRNAAPVSGAELAQAYAGKTDLWTDDCDGGIYYGPNGQARAWCAQKPDVLGAGTWRTDDAGRLCYHLSWYWPNGRRAGVSDGGEECINHVGNRWGRVWRNWPGSAEWWPMDRHAGMTRGYVFRDEVARTQARLGL